METTQISKKLLTEVSDFMLDKLRHPYLSGIDFNKMIILRNQLMETYDGKEPELTAIAGGELVFDGKGHASVTPLVPVYADMPDRDSSRQYTDMANLDRDIAYVEKYLDSVEYLSPEHRIALIADAALLKLKALQTK